jgi:putative ABC transport system permease protein
MFSYEEDCFEIMDMSSIEDTMEQMLGMVSALLAGIASIALVVGGIGIMNMMLTTVTERTTEIGLKKALGAIPWQIQAQFLIESFLLSIIGGALGILALAKPTPHAGMIFISVTRKRDGSNACYTRR